MKLFWCSILVCQLIFEHSILCESNSPTYSWSQWFHDEECSRECKEREGSQYKYRYCQRCEAEEGSCEYLDDASEFCPGDADGEQACYKGNECTGDGLYTGEWTTWKHYTEEGPKSFHCYAENGVCRMRLNLQCMDEERRECERSETSGAKFECVAMPSSIGFKRISASSCTYKKDRRPEPGTWSEWSEFSCTSRCKSDSETLATRTRACDGDSCIPDPNGRETTDIEACIEDLDGPQQIIRCRGSWTEWGSWGSCEDCSVESTRNRECLGYCLGNSTQSSPCEVPPECIDTEGGWSLWTPWSECSATCRKGRMTRTRECNNPAPAGNGAQCRGKKQNIKRCFAGPCIVDGKWGRWGPFSECSSSCGPGSNMRERACDSPAPGPVGEPCEGENSQTNTCTVALCPVDGAWGEWSEYGSCSVTCGRGIQGRTRYCSRPPPIGAGLPCPGDNTDVKDCDQEDCDTSGAVIDGNWGEWVAWSPCDRTCGEGVRGRHRYCRNPSPSGGGADCQGDDRETDQCTEVEVCPVDGGWATWKDWQSCSVSCGGGVRSRQRTCDDPEPAGAGSDCSGNALQTQTCSTRTCPVDGGWSSFGAWSECSSSCGVGSRRRQRKCDDPRPVAGGAPCDGHKTETETCPNDPCPVNGAWSTWSAWGVCPVSCGAGIIQRQRSCSKPEPSSGGDPCAGENALTRACGGTTSCPVDGGWSDWTYWSSCSVSCGEGSKQRSRSCSNPQPKAGGEPCTGADEETFACNAPSLCPIHGHWGEWTQWSCDRTCDGGVATRSRHCNNPIPRHGGRPCSGRDHATEEGCNAEPCAPIPFHRNDQLNRDISLALNSYLEESWNHEEVSEGSSIELDCDLEVIRAIEEQYGPVQVTWFHNQKPLMMNPTRMDYHAHQLKIHPTTYQDTGFYMCQAEFGTDATRMLDVFSLVVISEIITHNAPVGSPLELPCHSSTLMHLHDDVSIVWWHNNTVRLDYTGVEVALIDPTSVEAQVSDAGVWYCVVTQSRPSNQNSPSSWVTNWMRVGIVPSAASMSVVGVGLTSSGLLGIAGAVVILVVMCSLICHFCSGKIKENSIRKLQDVKAMKKLVKKLSPNNTEGAPLLHENITYSSDELEDSGRAYKDLCNNSDIEDQDIDDSLPLPPSIVLRESESQSPSKSTVRSRPKLGGVTMPKLSGVTMSSHHHERLMLPYPVRLASPPPPPPPPTP